MKQKMVEAFAKVFGDNTGVRVFFAPGRVNLIGEHTDYNGGHVFPCALTIGTYAAAKKNGTDKFRVYSMNFEQLGIIESDINALVYDKAKDWANYPFGTICTLNEAGYPVAEGMDIVYFGNIPNSSGLSSSASIEVLTAYVVRELFGYSYDGVEIAKLTQKAENKFIGVNCGIMDQFAIAMGKKNHAIFLDTATLEYEYAPISLDGMKIVIACSNKKRGLGDSKYNERRSECEAALALLQQECQIASLGDLTEEEFEAHKAVIADEVKIRRAKHAVYENQRTVKAVEALQKGDIAEFGQLMNASHVSLRDDYEVTGKELDTLVETSWEAPGVVGARMTGAGFGGCTVSIVKEESVEKFIEMVGAKYLDVIGYAADFYVVEIGDGPTEL